VIAILGIMATLTAPAVSSILRGSNLNRGGQMIGDQFVIARQEAVSKNRDIEVRFYNLTNGMFPGWRGIQLWRIEQTPTGPVTNSFSRVTVIPDGIVMASNSPSGLISDSPLSNSVTLPGYGANIQYRGFRFRANGSLEMGVGANNYVTLYNASDAGKTTTNYYTIQINTLTGKASVFRP
jgi:uncharacterized protein (TIGR02596 family)